MYIELHARARAHTHTHTHTHSHTHTHARTHTHAHTNTKTKNHSDWSFSFCLFHACGYVRVTSYPFLKSAVTSLVVLGWEKANGDSTPTPTHPTPLMWTVHSLHWPLLKLTGLAPSEKCHMPDTDDKIICYESLATCTGTWPWLTFVLIYILRLTFFKLLLISDWRTSRRELYKGKKEGQLTALRVQELCESRGGRPWFPVLMNLTVSVDVKQHWTAHALVAVSP